MKKKIIRSLAIMGLAALFAGCQTTPASPSSLSLSPHTISEDTQSLLHLMPQGDSTFFFDLHLNETVDGLEVQSWTLTADHQWQEEAGGGTSGMLEHDDKILMIQVLTDQSRFAWSCDGVSSPNVPIGEDGTYFTSDWGARGTDRLDKTVDVQLNQPVPLLLILEKDGVHDGQLSMEVNDLMQSLEHPERVDADRALLITVKLR